MDLPSGRTFSNEDLDLLKMMDRCGSIRYTKEGFTLSSGIHSQVYVFMRGDITDNPSLGRMLGIKIARTIVENYQEGDKKPCLIGIPTAGTGIAAATSLAAFYEGICTPAGEISYRIMREAEKAHGAGATNWVNGKFDEDHTFWSLDNVVTDGKSKTVASGRLIESGYPALKMPSLIAVDRQQGGVRRMEQYGFERIVVVLYLLDIAYAMGEINTWPKSVAKSVDEEIQAHQF